MTGTTRTKTRALPLRSECSSWAVTTLLCGAVVASEETPARRGAYEGGGIGGVCGEGCGRPGIAGARSANRRLYHERQWR